MNETTTKMNFQDFTEAIKERFKADYPGCRIKTGTVEKNNGLCLTGLTILKEGTPLSPTLYPEQNYSSYLDGKPFEAIVEELESFYEKSLDIPGFQMPDVGNFEAVKEKICFKLINKGRNKKRLREMPYRNFLDLAVTYYIPVTIKKPYDANLGITNKFLRLWHVEEETLYQHALVNTRKLFPVRLQSMEDVIKGFGPDFPSPIPFTPLSIFRCDGDCGGAAAIIYDSELKRCAEIFGDFYILPSSVYETILCPLSYGKAPKEDMLSMVREINAKEVLSDEVLSDNAYLYHADTGEIEILE